MSTFKPVDAGRLSFPGKPSFDPTPYLDPISKQIYVDPLKVRTDPQNFVGRLPKLKVHCSRNEKAKLFSLLDASDRLRLHHPQQVAPDYGSGLFSVTKDLNRDRLILDSRGANLLETPPRRWTRSLAAAESLTKFVLDDG